MSAIPEIESKSTEHTSFTSLSTGRLRNIDLCLGVGGLITWILLFSAGALVASEPYRKELGGSNPIELSLIFQYSIVVLISYTVTNVAMLCCIASMLGGIYRGSTRVEPNETAPSIIGIRLLPYTIQGFVIFLLIVSGLFLFGDEPFTNLTQTKYIRLAGSASLFSFIAGYKPRVFYKWLTRFDDAEPVRSRTKER